MKSEQIKEEWVGIIQAKKKKCIPGREENMCIDMK